MKVMKEAMKEEFYKREGNYDGNAVAWKSAIFLA